MFLKPIKSFLGVTGSVLGISAFLAWYYQDKLIYFPSIGGQFPHDNPQGFRTPGEAGLVYEDVNIQTTDDVNLFGWFIKTKNPQETPTIVVFQGNAGNIGYRIPFIKQLHVQCNCNVLIVGYRGYSYSEGKPSERGLQIDAIAILDHVIARKDIDVNKIFVMGSSLGGAVGTFALSFKRYNIAGLIIENTFTSMEDMVDRVIPAISQVKKFVLTNHWDSVKRIERVQTPILFISGLKDELVPPEHMQILYDAAKESILREKLMIGGGTHNETWALGGKKYFESISNFIRRVEIQRQEMPKL